MGIFWKMEADISALRAAWRALSQAAAQSPALAEGIARRRSEQLAGVEPWRIPDILDELNREDSHAAL